jgi:hypothetical protein
MIIKMDDFNEKTAGKAVFLFAESPRNSIKALTSNCFGEHFLRLTCGWYA